tara:strand:- start:451 stop:588 length:138 start_codon:yes stop_codon:yes gene_type:complete
MGTALFVSDFALDKIGGMSNVNIFHVGIFTVNLVKNGVRVIYRFV